MPENEKAELCWYEKAPIFEFKTNGKDYKVWLDGRVECPDIGESCYIQNRAAVLFHETQWLAKVAFDNGLITRDHLANFGL